MSSRRTHTIQHGTELAKAEVDDVLDSARMMPRDSRVDAVRMASNALRSPFTGWPHCAVCDRPVEDVQTDRDIVRRSLIFYAVCHGEHEEVELTSQQLEGATAIDIGGTVFDRPRLEAKT